MAKCRHCPADAKDDLCHVFYGCVMFPALYWACALEIFNDVLTLTKHCGSALRSTKKKKEEEREPLTGPRLL
jgi:hypothetical protein